MSTARPPEPRDGGEPSQPAPRRASRWALVGLFGGAVGIGFAPIFVRLSELGPNATAFWRLCLALPLLWLWSRRASAGADTGATPRPVALLALAGLLFAGDLALWHWSIRFTSVANSTLLANCAPIFVTLGAWWLFGERFGLTFLVGLATALAGAAMLVGHSFSLDAEHILGDALGLATAVFYGSYILTVKRLRSQVDTPTLMAVSGAVTAAALLVVTVVSGETLLAPTARGWAVLAGLAWVSHVGGQGLIAWALAHLPASLSSVTLLFQPAVATALAWLLFAEALHPWQGLGALVILAGVLLARRGSERPLRSAGAPAGSG